MKIFLLDVTNVFMNHLQKFFFCTIMILNWKKWSNQSKFQYFLTVPIRVRNWIFLTIRVETEEATTCANSEVQWFSTLIRGTLSWL